jgi:hypothetical protein
MTIGQQIKWDFEANGYLEIKNKNGKRIYFEDLDGFWTKREYDSKCNQIYYENSNGRWRKSEYDSEGNLSYFEKLNEFWKKMEYDSQGNLIYYEDSTGRITDKRPKPCSDKEIVIEGVKYKLIKV